MKVTNNGSYYLLDKDKNIISQLIKEYCPDSHSIPGQYGDYINFEINMKTGVIENWFSDATFQEFFQNDDED
jgi:hypothetical protein